MKVNDSIQFSMGIKLDIFLYVGNGINQFNKFFRLVYYVNLKCVYFLVNQISFQNLNQGYNEMNNKRYRVQKVYDSFIL